MKETHTMTQKLLLFGGGHCRSVLDCVQALHAYADVGIVARDAANARELEQDPELPAPVVGTDAQLPDLRAAGWTHAFATIGSVGNAEPRRHAFVAVRDSGFTLPAIIDPTAVIAARVHVGAVARQGIRSGAWAWGGAGGVVVRDVPEGARAYGNPCRVMGGQGAL